jgi:hypothetical protein
MTLQLPPKLPLPSATLVADEVSKLLDTYQAWSKSTGHVLLDLDDELGRHPNNSNTAKADHTLAFVIWTAADKVIGEAIQTLAFPDLRLAPLRAPLVALDGTKLASNVEEAAQIVVALEASVSKQLADAAIASASRVALVESLATAAPLVKQLSMRAGELAQLRTQLDKLPTDAPANTVADLSRRAAALRNDLQEALAERSALLNGSLDEASILSELAEMETRARSVSELGRQKVLQSPRVGIVSVSALGTAPDVTDLELKPWPQMRALLAERSLKLDRARQALQHVITANESLLAKRGELRQLVDAYRAKAMAGRIGEVSEVNSAYQRAREALWSAPCDLEVGAEAVQNYVLIVTNRLETNGSQLKPERSELR